MRKGRWESTCRWFRLQPALYLYYANLTLQGDRDFIIYSFESEGDEARDLIESIFLESCFLLVRIDCYVLLFLLLTLWR